MIKIAANLPAVNDTAIQDRGLQNLGYKPPTSTSGVLNQFQIGIGNEMAVVPGRILPPPQVLYGGNKNMHADNASWNLRDIRFQSGATLSRWGVVIIKDGGRVCLLPCYVIIVCPNTSLPQDESSWPFISATPAQSMSALSNPNHHTFHYLHPFALNRMAGHPWYRTETRTTRKEESPCPVLGRVANLTSSSRVAGEKGTLGRHEHHPGAGGACLPLPDEGQPGGQPGRQRPQEGWR